ncbi:malto-oligosyltrehalose synthase [Marmoricola sp. RAF53]|uniref:malto-oligosyltrehalose synthase n=1 Tax=Marmoricola sp. RAF53 TaxID=3233059 RepID=UPI003F9ABAE9
MRSVPSSTYRLQLSADFTFEDAAGLLPYLRDLGVGWIYLSPVLQATPGSTHGYDVVDPTRIDEDRGGEAAFDELCREAHRNGLGVLVDLVPNHVGVARPELNPWWWSVLQQGRDSRFASAFDIDWPAAGDKVVFPVLGEDDVRADGTTANLRLQDGELRYHDHLFPVAPGSAAPDDDPNQVLDRQHYALRPWREEATRLNYRRFFGVSSLAAVRVEDLDVFELAHVQVRRWIASGLVDGLRIDHPDGLRHPGSYLVMVADLIGDGYLVVEKILEPGEDLPRSWPVHGTTGYEALGLVDRVLVDPVGVEALATLDRRLRAQPGEWPELLHDAKLEVTRVILGSEVRRLARELAEDLPGTDRGTLVAVLEELLACFPVYRSYLPDGAHHLEHAAEEATRRRPDLADAVERVWLLLRSPTHPAALRFQQTSGMVMAKGAEDRAFYRWSPLTSLDEVGGDPDTLAITAEDFHHAMRERWLRCPDAMTTTSTHDTKRGEDVRARIDALAELPDWWTGILRDLLDAVPVPDAGLGNLLWQAIVGCWPASEQRLAAYAEKAMREAAQQTTWTEPDEGFEAVVHAAVRAAYADPAVHELVDAAATELAPYGWSNGLAAKLLALTMPGVPDVYQGSELWEQSLVDPDNRRPVDFEARRRMLHDLDAAGAHAPARPTRLDDPGAAKLHLVSTVLRLRRDRPELFADYQPVRAEGPAAEHVLAFDRGGLIAVVTRMPVGLARRGGWGDTRLVLPAGRYRDVLSGRCTGPGTAELLECLPVAVLVREA